MTDKPKRRRAKKLGCHPLDDGLPSLKVQLSITDDAPTQLAGKVDKQRSQRIHRPFYTAPRRCCAGPMLTNDDLRERELDENRREDPLGYWGTFRDEVV